MKIPHLHAWPTTAKEAIELQRALAPRIVQRRVKRPPRWIAGLDAAVLGRERVIAGVVLWDAEERAAVEEHVVAATTAFPYIPGLLSFREAPALIEALRRLGRRPDALLCDGQGLAHPRRFGLASHVGLWAGIPTIGCAKSRLCGTHDEPAAARGSRCDLRIGDETVGAVLRTRDRVKPLFISPGHLCDLASAMEITLSTATRFRLPEPTRLADKLVAKAKRSFHNRGRENSVDAGAPGR